MEISTPLDFARELLNRLGLPESDNNLKALVAAQAVEGGHMHNGAAFNPLNTTWKMPGSHAATKIGVQSYLNWDDGLTATAKTFSNGLYKDILASLAKSAPPDETLSLRGWRTWGWDRSVGKANIYQSYGSAKFPDAQQHNKEISDQPQQSDMISQIEDLLSKFVSTLSNKQSLLIKVSSNDFWSSMEYARILCTAMEEELNVYSNVHTDLSNVEIECNAMYEPVELLCNKITGKFMIATNKIGLVKVATKILKNKKSNYQECSIKLAEVSYDMFHQKFAGLKNGK